MHTYITEFAIKLFSNKYKHNKHCSATVIIEKNPGVSGKTETV